MFFLFLGEDTMGQMDRCFGPADAARRIQQLKFVWVSHMHADHHGGLYPLLLRREKLLLLQQQQQQQNGEGAAAGAAEPLLILGPWPMFRVLQTYSQV
jgi:ribonuclease Z